MITGNGLAGVPCVEHGRSCDGSTDFCEPLTLPPTAEGHVHTLAVDIHGLPYCVDCWRGERLWFEPNDHAILTFLDEETGETAEIHALCIRPSGAGPGWVLTDGTRLPLRPRPVIKCDIVYPDAHKGTEIVIHPIPDPDDTTEHTTPEETPPT